MQKTQYDYDVLKFELKINNKNHTAILDTGANFSVINNKLVDTLKLPIEIQTKDKVTLANNTIMSSHGICKSIPVIIANHDFNLDAIILPDTNYDLLLGTNFLIPNLAKFNLKNNTITIGCHNKKTINPI